MLYLGIDQHRKQLTVCVRNEQGDVILRRQVSTEWVRVRAFFAGISEEAGGEGFVVVLEVCGLNHWLVKLLGEYDCRELIVVQPEKRSKKKTDRRDAGVLCEILWVNRQRLLAGKRVQGVRRVELPSEEDGDARQVTQLRKRLGELRTRAINRIKKRRGSKIARVAVMRRLATIIWQMVKYKEPYVIGGPPKEKLGRGRV